MKYGSLGDADFEIESAPAPVGFDEARELVAV